MLTKEQERLKSHREKKSNWKKWGPYLSERGWGTVREDYSEKGDAWMFFSHEQARSRTYRWGEDGIGGICDRHQFLCFAPSFWNGKDPLLKERLFGLTGPEGNHGEDVKEVYYYIDNTPTHSYMKMLYRYPHKAFPYVDLVEKNQQRGCDAPEYELLDTGIFAEDSYFDMVIEYAKVSEEDILLQITATNRGKEKAYCAILPTFWFRNTWSWGYDKGPMGSGEEKPSFTLSDAGVLHGKQQSLGQYYIYAENAGEWLFTENETNREKLFGVPNHSPHVKDAFHRYLIEKEKRAVNSLQQGSKACCVYEKEWEPQESITFRLRLCNAEQMEPFAQFSPLMEERRQEADAFYAAIQNPHLMEELKVIQRQAFAGLLWTKQFYYFDFEQWQKGDPHLPAQRQFIRNKEWDHLTNFDVLSVPDKWEYPYFCAWDTAFHSIPLVLVDPDYAKRQLTLMTREWYMHPNGQLPAYEWSFSDVNPPVHAWGAWRVYKIDAKQCGTPDRAFLEGIFHKLLLNFTWWLNKKDVKGNDVFQGGFLGMDNISVFNRSEPLPTGGYIDQSDGSAWMAFYCICLMKIALHLSLEEPVYQDIATKFFEHFLRIAQAITNCGGKGVSLWDEEDGFFYDALHFPDDTISHLKVRSMVGLIPLLAVETLTPEMMEKLPIFTRRLDWFVGQRPQASYNVACIYQLGEGRRRLLSLLTKERLIRVLRYLFDEKEFLSPYGIRSLSKYHAEHPFHFTANGRDDPVRYVPAESDNRMFGGNSNWRGPIWFPLNFLLIESLQKFHHYYGDDLKVEFPTGSGKFLNLWDASIELSQRLINLFLPDQEGKRPIYGEERFNGDHLLFYEYFDGDKGKGLGASHQTGWTGLLAKLIQQSGGVYTQTD